MSISSKKPVISRGLGPLADILALARTPLRPVAKAIIQRDARIVVAAGNVIQAQLGGKAALEWFLRQPKTAEMEYTLMWFTGELPGEDTMGRLITPVSIDDLLS